MPTSFSASALAHLQASFLALVLPRVLSHGRVCFRGIKCPHRREDAIQEMIGLGWQFHLRLAEKGKDATCFPAVLACYPLISAGYTESRFPTSQGAKKARASRAGAR